MKSRIAIPLWALLMLAICQPLTAQFSNPTIENFGPPNIEFLGGPDGREGTQVLPVGTDLYEGDDVNTIYYGLTPPNSSNKPVLVFVHGYASSASVWYTGRDNMYKDAYQDGYRTAFVSLTPNRHMWTNGFMLANMIDEITQYYGVSSVKVVAWSKGGVDSDAAIVHFGAGNKVSEAFTLSTPHNGTSIAEAANSILLSLVNIIAMQNNDATKSLTRGYMSYFRSITDGSPNNTTPFTTLGGWGNGPLNRLDIPQALIHGIDGPRANGGNDGVVPYQSSRRPGGRELFDGQRKEYGWFGIPYYPGPAETELDHFEVTRGIVWPYVRDVFNGTLRMPAPNTPEEFNPNRTVSSQMQLVASAGGANKFSVASEEVRLYVMSADGQPMQVIDANGNEIELEWLEGDAQGQWFRMVDVQAGTYRVEGEGQFAAMVMEPEGPSVDMEMLYGESGCIFDANDAIRMRVKATGVDLNSPSVTGTLQRLHDLEFNSVADAPVPVRFSQDGELFIGEAGAHMPAGVYSATVSFNDGDVARTLTATFTKVGDEPIMNEVMAPQLEVQAFPNPFTESVRLSADFEGHRSAEVRIYDIFGKELRKYTLESTDGQAEWVWEARQEGMSSGLYIVEVTTLDGASVTKKIVLE